MRLIDYLLGLNGNGNYYLYINPNNYDEWMITWYRRPFDWEFIGSTEYLHEIIHGDIDLATAFINRIPRIIRLNELNRRKDWRG